jgi:pimeloyl-ACP methyl ester carboxylesterase
MATIQAVGATAQVNGVTLAFDDTGGDGPVVMLSHGFLMDRTMFDDQVAALRNEYRVITWDERGFGETIYDERPFTYWDSARDCLALMEHLGIERAVLGGMSQGGFIALRAALLDPQRVRGLVLLSTQAGPEDADVIPIYQGMIDAWIEEGPSIEAAEVSAELILGEPELFARWTAVWMERSPESLRNPAQALVEREGIEHRLSEIPAPALVVHGTADISISLDKAQRMADGLVGCAGVVAVAGGTHSANLTHPQQVNEAILGFLAGLPD